MSCFFYFEWLISFRDFSKALPSLLNIIANCTQLAATLVDSDVVPVIAELLKSDKNPFNRITLLKILNSLLENHGPKMGPAIKASLDLIAEMGKKDPSDIVRGMATHVLTVAQAPKKKSLLDVLFQKS